MTSMFIPTHALPAKPLFDPFQQPQTQSQSISPATISSSPPGVSRSYPLQYAFTVQYTIAPPPRHEDILFASENAKLNWTHPLGCPPEKQLPRELPIYQGIVRDLESACQQITNNNSGCVAIVKAIDPHNSLDQRLKDPTFENSRPKRDAGVSIWISAPESSIIMEIREVLLTKFPVLLTMAFIDLDCDHYFNENQMPKENINAHLCSIAKWTGTDIFVVRPEKSRTEAAGDPEIDSSQGKRLKVRIYGDYESVEHAKTRVLVMIDDLLGRRMISIHLEVSLHTPMSGRGRKQIKKIESETGTAIYLPPPFPSVYGYVPNGANPRHPDEIYITGKSKEDLSKAEMALRRLAMYCKAYVKEATLDFRKIDYLLMERLEEVKKIVDFNGTHIQFPQISSKVSCIRVQGLELLHVERTIRSVMSLVGQFYNATWWMMNDQNTPELIRIPSSDEFQRTILDVSARSGADVGWHRNHFTILGADWAVRRSIELLNDFDFARCCKQYQIRVLIEVANEHKEFVAGKKNGKINKIMSHAGVSVLFESHNDYNFHIDVKSHKFDCFRQGLELVEQELPASMSFHVPDSYHKRIIGIGGQHIQTIMKKFSVFVKFSNAMERGTAGKPDSEDLKVDNVVCRTPARNAANLELVKNEIMEMVQQADADITTETVEIPRLHHRTFGTHVIADLEKKSACKFFFPTSEEGSDVVTIKGPEWRIPHAKEGLLALIPVDHQVRLSWSMELEEAIRDQRFTTEVIQPMNTQLGIEITFVPRDNTSSGQAEQTVKFVFTRNNAGGLEDAIDRMMNYLLLQGVEGTKILEGQLSRPKSNSFEDYAAHFETALIHKTQERPGSRLSGDSGSIHGEKSLQSEPQRIISDTEAAFYNGDRKRSSLIDAAFVAHHSSGSPSSHNSIHSRANSLDSISQASQV